MDACYRILVAIETDATPYHGEASRRPKLLPPGDTEQLLAHLAADLQALLPGLPHCRLAAPGALLDQTQVLRPGYPAFAALESAALDPAASRPGARIAIGASDGRIEPAALHPEPGIPLGILQLVPIVVCGPAGDVAALGEEMEHRFLERGQVSAHTARWLESAFGIATRHARFMTLTDLNAMFRLQLEHFGFLPLWELIDAALSRRTSPFEVHSGRGQAWTWREQAAHTAFQTFDCWARSGPGRQVESARGKLAGEYADWTREWRQYLGTLGAHAVPVRLHWPGNDEQVLEGSWCMETPEKPPAPHSAAVTEHSFGELGTVCITTVRDGRQTNRYPLTAAGLNDIEHAVRRDGAGDGAIAYPGTLLYDPVTRTLVPDRDEPAPRRGPP